MNIHDCLVALPVAGDAFLLHRQGRQILVDGGTGSTRLLQELHNFKIYHLDIVVCTHADRDHAGGLVDFLDNSLITVGEFWLPGAWAETLPKLITEPDTVVDGLIDTLDKWGEVRTWNRSFGRLKKYLHQSVSNERRKHRKEKSSREKNPISSRDERMEKEGLPREWFEDELQEGINNRKADEAFDSGRNRVWRMHLNGNIRIGAAVFWLGLIDTAERIRKIALQAHRHNVAVRWFDFGEFDKTRQASGGEKDLLVPLNSVELFTPPPQPLELTYFNRLTPVNEECLVFVSPPPSNVSLWSISVVFTGDSPLGEGTNYAESWLEWPDEISNLVIATAPHHGSENNSAAYNHLLSKVDVLLWVRSGGNRRHPGNTYRAISNQRRICTHCPRTNLPPQAAMAILGHLVIRTYGHLCRC